MAKPGSSLQFVFARSENNETKGDLFISTSQEESAGEHTHFKLIKLAKNSIKKFTKAFKFLKRKFN